MRASNPLHMVLEPDDLAGAYVFLASPSARGITGTVVTVDAGSMLRMRRRR
jgi:enoyl-[acyl-carrier-protein] reductase (NADH)